MADPDRARRAGGGAGARLGGARLGAGGGRPARRRAAAGGDRRRRAAQRRARRARPQRVAALRLARRWPPRARRAPASCCTCTTTGSSARSRPASRAAQDCTRCHGRNTLPGVRLNCRGSRAESVVYGASLALWQRRLAESADAFVVPSAFALGRLEELGAPLGGRARVIPSVQRSFAAASAAGSGRFALAAGRLTPEKGFADAVAACAAAGVPLVVAGDGPAARGAARAGRRRALRRAGERRRARAPAERGRARHRPLALRRDPAAGRAGGDGRRAAGRRGERRRAGGDGARRRACTRRATWPR